MSALVFLVEVGAFVLVAYWAYRNGNIGVADGGRGLFAMKADEPAPGAEPRWKRGAARKPQREERANGPEPRWKTTPRRREAGRL
jgi:hypothetical protein